MVAFSFENVSFHGDISFEIVMVQFGPLINIKYWSNGHEWKDIMKDDNPNRNGTSIFINRNHL